MRQALIGADGVLKSHGFTQFSAGVGETVLEVADDFSLEPGRWRHVSGQFQTYTAPPAPDVKKFEGALKAYFANNLSVLNTLLAKYPLFLWSLRDENWLYVQQMLMAALAAGDLTQAQYDNIKTIAASKSIPVTL